MIGRSTIRDDFLPTAELARLRLRAEVLGRVRSFLAARGFLEVETPLLSADTVVDRHLDPFCVELGDGLREARRYWLQTSPEFAMKRLLAAGATAIYQVARAFRRDEEGPLHNCEFTLVEWYRAGDSLEEAMALTGELAETVLGRGAAERTSYAAAFAAVAGVDPHTAAVAELAAACRRLEITVPESLGLGDRDGWLDLIFAEGVQPQIGRDRPTLLFHYPASQAALAGVLPGPPPVAERFELFVDGIELANGYHELRDAAELRRRIAANNRLRLRDGKAPLPETSRLLAAMDRGLPPCAGVALGFDRLVMLAAGAARIEEVVAFPFHRA